VLHGCASDDDDDGDLIDADSVAAAAAATTVPASEGGRCIVIPGQSQATVCQSTRSLQQVPRHYERVQVSDVRMSVCLSV